MLKIQRFPTTSFNFFYENTTSFFGVVYIDDIICVYNITYFF